ncbi:probable FEN1 - fatty acid elongase [Melanopsichium pennsylvanicum]|uniref:Elongation of fatty acids protein n=2 Tax=Melanopsichium pennsylvanicum TaxID=63383 RepID=A0AAJ4XNC2_9BASI|nr:probable FEN1-fatty acid elongase [Melanopsichium pennsylvanicum 4]SNX85775.1 probable FEN1 - fatty acid elongase [Melanopsichium pennsylvanicum]
MVSSVIYDAVVATIPQHIKAQTPVHLLAWIPGKSPISTVPALVTAVITYLAVIFGGRELMKNRAPFTTSIKLPFLLHNLALTFGSGLLLALMLEEILPIVRRNGLFYGICGEGAWTMKLETYYMINYYFKYWELIDTVFLVLKKKPLAFLHVYHHSATAVLCFSQLHGKTSVSWVVICLNLAVHVLMYFYYALTSLKIRCPWKKWVTTAQITQFVIDLFVVYFASYNYFVYTYFPNFPHVGTCAGKEHAAFSGIICLTSYLFLFIAFYQKTYAKDKARKLAAKINGKVNEKANGKTNGKSR